MGQLDYAQLFPALGRGFFFSFQLLSLFNWMNIVGVNVFRCLLQIFGMGQFPVLCWLLSEVFGDGVTERSAIGTDSRVSAMSATVLWVDLAKASWIT